MFTNFNFTFLEKGKTCLGVYIGNLFLEQSPILSYKTNFAHVCSLFSCSNFIRNTFNEYNTRYI